MARLNTTVHVHDPDRGTVAFGPKDEVLRDKVRPMAVPATMRAMGEVA